MICVYKTLRHRSRIKTEQMYSMAVNQAFGNFTPKYYERNGTTNGRYSIKKNLETEPEVTFFYVGNGHGIGTWNFFGPETESDSECKGIWKQMNESAENIHFISYLHLLWELESILFLNVIQKRMF